MTKPPSSERGLYRRGIRWISRYIPHFFIWIAAHSVVEELLLFFSLAFTVHIVNAISLGEELVRIQGRLFAFLLTMCFLKLVESALRRRKEAKWDLLYHAVDRLITDKLLMMDQADADDPAVRDELQILEETAKALGEGLVQLPEMVQNACRGAVGAAAAVVLSAQAFVTCPYMIPVWALLLAVVVWGNERARRLRQTSSKAIADIDRVYYAFLDAADDPDKAGDMRLYRQDRVAERYLREAEERFFEEQGLKHRQAHGKQAAVKALFAVWPTLWNGLCTTFLLVQVYDGTLAIGSFIGCLGAFAWLPTALGRLAWSAERGRANRSYMAKFAAFSERPPCLYKGSLTTEKRADRDYEIAFRHVTFRYPSQEKAALEDVSVVFRKGSRTAIVGENGSGKSTMIKLLCRLYDPDEGEILLNGIDIRKYRYEEYAALIAAVFQDAQLFNGSVASNVAGSDTFDRERVIGCLADVGLNDAQQLMLEEAMTLSYSKKQRVTIARALYKDAAFLLLDEPTSAMDPFEEAALYNELERIVRDRTAVFVSHRLLSCRFCDEILVLDGGRIVERGTHDALISQGGRYYAFWNARAMQYKQD